jgi:perosamine synthetase
MGTDAIPWAKAEFWGREREYVSDAISSTWISGGPYVTRLESQFSEYLGGLECLAVSNGTTALHLTYLGIDIRAGDEIIVPGFAFMAAANVALHVGARPIFVEVDPLTWCMRPEDIEAKLSKRTKAIVPVHTYGNVCDMDAIGAIAAANHLPVIEDAAEAIGSRYKEKVAGSIGFINTFSLHATKTITTGEGGLVSTSDDSVTERMKLFRSHGVASRRYWHDVAGHNFRLTNMQAALGCAQFEHIDTIIQSRKLMYQRYVAALSTVQGITLQHFAPEVDPAVWAIALRLDASAFPQGRDRVMQQLGELGIETRPGFYSASQMRHLYDASDLPVCDAVAASVISLPSFPSITEEQIQFVVKSLRGLKH